MQTTKEKNPEPTKVIVEAVISKGENGDASSSIPLSVFENVTLIGHQLEIKPVAKLAYQYDNGIFGMICNDAGLDEEEYLRVKDLVFLNSGYITPALLRTHLTRGYGFCARLYESLISARQAAEPKQSRVFYKLPSARQSGFM